MAQKPALGKGLASLIPSSPPPAAVQLPQSDLNPSAVTSQPSSPAALTPETQNKDRHLGISMAAIADIHANQYQPRREFDETALQELAASIRTSGIIQPLVVRKGAKEGFELIAGERRLRAASIAGLKHVPIVIRKSTDRESLELALIENIQRRDLNCVDEAMAYFQLLQDFSLTQEEVAERVGKDRATVANYLRLLKLNPEILDDLKRQNLSFGHGKALLGIDDPQIRMRARAQVLEGKLSVRQTEALVEELKNDRKPASPESSEKTREESSLERRFNNISHELTRQWSTKIEVKGTESRGKIVIHYSSRQDLDRVLENMNGVR